VTEFGPHPGVRVSDVDTKSRQASTLRNLNIHGAVRLSMEGREIKWADMREGDVVTVERITDAAVYAKTEKDKDAYELKYLQADPASAGKIAQFLWPGRSLLRKFERATPQSWTTYETLWIEPRDQRHRWMRFGGQKREIAFITEEQFFRHAENWVNGTVNITDGKGNEVLLNDTWEDQCYTLVKADYDKCISYRWDGLLLCTKFDGSNARFWKKVKQVVNNPERLVLLNNGRQVSPDRALSRITYQLARMRNYKVLKEVEIRRGQDCIYVDLTEESAFEAVINTWGVADWRIVDSFGTPFADPDLRDGTSHFAIKVGERLEKRSAIRGFSKFTVDKTSDEVRFMIKCGNQIQHIWMQPFARWKLVEICQSIRGPGYYAWDDKEAKDLQGRVLHVQKKKRRPSSEKTVNFKVIYEDEPDKPIEMNMQSPCGKLVFDLSKTLRCRLWGRDFYLDTKDLNVQEEWEGKSFRVIWRMRGGMYKDDSWMNSPNPLDEIILAERKMELSIVCGEEWTKLQVSHSDAKEDCLGFIRNKYGARARAMVRHQDISETPILDQDVIVVYREKADHDLWVEIHLKRGTEVKELMIQSNTPAHALLSASERLFQKAVKRGQIMRPDDHVFVQEETVEIKEEDILLLEGKDIGFKVRLTNRSTPEILRAVKNIWWPKKEEEPQFVRDIEVGVELGRIRIGDLNLRPGPITREIIGRLYSGIIEWRNGEQGMIVVHKKRLDEIWTLDRWGVRTILASEWNCIEETEEVYVLQHDTLREGMLLEDWEAIRKSFIPRIKVWVRDDQDHPLFLSMSASLEVIASQISEQLGYTVAAEKLKRSDRSPWEGYWSPHQTIFIDGFWRWSVEVKNERFNVSQTNTLQDMKEQLRRLDLEATNFVFPEERGDGVIVRSQAELVKETKPSKHMVAEKPTLPVPRLCVKRKSRPEEEKLEEMPEKEVVWDPKEIDMEIPPLPSDSDDEADPGRPKIDEDSDSEEDPSQGLVGTLVIKEVSWPIGDRQIDPFLKAYFKEEEQEGWMLSERFRGN
jgi:hypothetical protein